MRDCNYTVSNLFRRCHAVNKYLNIPLSLHYLYVSIISPLFLQYIFTVAWYNQCHAVSMLYCIAQGKTGSEATPQSLTLRNTYAAMMPNGQQCCLDGLSDHNVVDMARIWWIWLPGGVGWGAELLVVPPQIQKKPIWNMPHNPLIPLQIAISCTFPQKCLDFFSIIGCNSSFRGCLAVDPGKPRGVRETSVRVRPPP